MSEATDALFEEFAELKRQEKILKTRMDEIKDTVAQAVKDNEGSYTGSNFELKFQSTAKYEFSAAVDALTTELKETKAKEKEDGTAQIVGYSEFVRFKDTSG